MVVGRNLTGKLHGTAYGISNSERGFGALNGMATTSGLLCTLVFYGHHQLVSYYLLDSFIQLILRQGFLLFHQSVLLCLYAAMSYYPPPGYGGPPPMGGVHRTHSSVSGNSSGYGAAPPPGRGGGYGYAAQAAPAGSDPQLWQFFTSVDADRSGQITLAELQRALVNGTYDITSLIDPAPQHIPRYSQAIGQVGCPLTSNFKHYP